MLLFGWQKNTDTEPCRCIGRTTATSMPPHIDSTTARLPVTGRIVSSAVPGSHGPFENVYSPPQGEGTFAYFCCRTKVWRREGRDPLAMVLILRKSTKATKEPSATLSFIELRLPDKKTNPASENAGFVSDLRPGRMPGLFYFGAEPTPTVSQSGSTGFPSGSHPVCQSHPAQPQHCSPPPRGLRKQSAQPRLHVDGAGPSIRY